MPGAWLRSGAEAGETRSEEHCDATLGRRGDALPEPGLVPVVEPGRLDAVERDRHHVVPAVGVRRLHRGILGGQVEVDHRRVVALVAIMALFGPWMLGQLETYTVALWASIPQMVGS